MSNSNSRGNYPVFFFMTKTFNLVYNLVKVMICGASGQPLTEILECKVTDLGDHYRIDLLITKEFRFELAESEMTLLIKGKICAVYDEMSPESADLIINGKNTEILDNYRACGLTEIYLLLNNDHVSYDDDDDDDEPDDDNLQRFDFGKQRLIVSTEKGDTF